jgi:hypothetical protein
MSLLLLKDEWEQSTNTRWIMWNPPTAKKEVYREESSTVCNITTAQRFNQFSASHPCKQRGKKERRSAGQSNYKVQAISRHNAQVGERISHQGPNSSMR